jgi:PST family polysaccharide transporter
LYGRAYQFINIPVDGLNSAIGGVVFAALSRLQNDPQRFRKYFLNSCVLMNSLTMPITVFCAVFANEIILTCLGPKWTDAASIFRLLSPTVMIFGIINTLAWLLLALGLYGRSFRVALVLSPLVIGSYILGVPFGPNGVALAYSAAMMLWLIPHVLWCTHGTIVSAWDLLLAVGRPLLCALLAGAVAIVAQFYLGDVSPFLRLIIGAGIMAVSYFVLILFVMRKNDLYLEVFRELRRTLSFSAKNTKGDSIRS